MELCKFEAILLYRESSRPARTILKDPVSKEEKKKLI